MAKFNIKIEIKNTAVEKLRIVTRRKLEALESSVLPEITVIEARTNMGLDADGSRFKDYSQGYKERMGKSDPPNLRVTGNMLSSMRMSDTKVFDTKAETSIVFGSNAEVLKAKGNMRLRKFFALSADQIQRIIERIKRA